MVRKEEFNLRESKNWRKRFNSSNFYSSFFLSFSFASVYFFLCNFVDSPPKKLFLLKGDDFFLSSYPHFISNFFVSLLLTLFSTLSFSGSGSYFDSESSFFPKLLSSNFYSLLRIFSSGTFSFVTSNYKSKKTMSYLLLLSYTFYFFSNYVTEMIITQIEKQGIFEGTRLVYFAEEFYQPCRFLLTSMNLFEINFSSPLVSRIKGLEGIVFSFFLFFMFQVSVLTSKIKWEVPVENNSSYFPAGDSDISNYFLERNNEDRPKFSLSFGLDHYTINTTRFYLSLILKSLGLFPKIISENHFLSKVTSIFSNKSSGGYSLLIFFLASFLFYLPYNYFVRSKQLASELKSKSVYFDGVAFDNETRNFLFIRTSQIFFFKQVLTWIVALLYDFLVLKGFSSFHESPDCLNLLFFISGLLHIFEQSENYWRFMAFYK